MTKKAAPDLPEIVQIAVGLEQDLQQLEALSSSVGKARLNTEKSISRAARTLQDALQQQGQLAGRLETLGQGMLRLQQRQQAAIDTLGERAKAIQSQFSQLAEHMARFGELGKSAAEVTQMLQALQASPAAAGAEATPDSAAALSAVEQRLAAIADDARALAGSAQAADLSEVCREATALGQRLDSARAKLTRLAGPPRADAS